MTFTSFLKTSVIFTALFVAEVMVFTLLQQARFIASLAH